MSAGPSEVAARVLALATAQSDSLAVADDRRRLAYGELARSASAAAAALRADGVVPGDRVGLISDNSADYLVAALGTWIAGAVLAPIHPAFGPSELQYVVGNAQPRVILVEEGRTAMLNKYDVEVRSLESVARSDAGGVEKPADVDPNALALIYYTSGSTGRPKPVAHSHAGIAAGVIAYIDVWHLSSSDRTLVCLPMSLAFGLTTGSIATLLAGGTVVVLPRYKPVRVAAAMSAERITVFHGVTTMFVKMLDYLRDEGKSLGATKLRLCISGGEPRNEPAFAQWRELTGCPVHDTYCASECWPVVTYDPRQDPEPRLGSAGRVVPGAEIRIIDPDGNDVATGKIGEGIWRAPALMLGYWNESGLTDEAFTADGWFRSRDLVRMDESGYVYVTGRIADTIIRGGSNISPAEVESVIVRHDGVRDVAVVGIADPVYGEEVAAAVVLAPGVDFDPEALAAFCRADLAAYKVPTRYLRVTELPRNANGKLVRRDVVPMIGSDAVSVA